MNLLANRAFDLAGSRGPGRAWAATGLGRELMSVVALLLYTQFTHVYAQPRITTVTPLLGPIGSSVTISGTNFSPGTNIVYFGAVKAAVTAARTNSLTVIVPPGATYAPVSVTANGLTAYSRMPYLPTFPSSRVISAASFGPRLDLPVNWPNKVEIADLDGDGKPDLITTENNLSSRLWIRRNISVPGTLSDASFEAPVTFDSGSDSTSVTVADLDGDGKLDLVLVSRLVGLISIFRNTSTPGTIDTQSFAPRVDISFPFSYSTEILVSDLDLDGKPDLITHGSTNIAVFRNLSTPGNISFASVALFPEGEPMKVADFDGDDKPDIIVAYAYADNVSILRNMSTAAGDVSSFSQLLNFATGNYPIRVAVGDLDGDGKLDMTTANYGTNTLSFLRNISTPGTITSNSFLRADLSLEQSPYGLAIGDLDGDGKPDIVLRDSVDSTIPVFKNFAISGMLDSNSFALVARLDTGAVGNDVRIADLDGDGKPEIIINLYDTKTIAIFLNTMLPPLQLYAPVTGNGAVTISPQTNEYLLGQTFSLTAAPRTKWWQFVRWSDGNTNNPRSITIGLSNNVYQAIFTNIVPLEELVFKEWDKSFGGTSNDTLNVVRPTANGGFLVGGTSSSSISGNKTVGTNGKDDFWVFRLDGAGNKLWETNYGGVDYDFLQDLQQTSDGGFVIAGYRYSETSGFGSDDGLVMRFDANRNKQWERTFGGIYSDRFLAVRQTPDGGYILVGDSLSGVSGSKTSTNYGGADFWVVKLGPGGDEQWEQDFGGSGKDECYAVEVTRDGGYMLAGESGSPIGGSKTSPRFGSGDAWVIKLDGSGAEQWERTFGGDYGERALAVKQTADGGFLLACDSSSDVSGNKTTPNPGGVDSYDYWVVKLDGDGNKVWEQEYGGSYHTPAGIEADDYMSAMALTSDGAFVVAGSSFSSPSGNKTAPSFGGQDFWVVRADEGGAIRWDESLGGTGDDIPYDVQPTLDGGYIVCGSSASSTNGNKTSPNYGGTDGWLVKLIAREAPVGTPVVLINGQYNRSNSITFTETNSARITIQTSFTNGMIFYTLDGSAPGTNSIPYGGAFILTNSAAVARIFTLRAIAYPGGFGQGAEADPFGLTYVARPLQLQSQGTGSISASPPQSSYALGQQVMLTATPGRWYQFVRWSDGGTNMTRTITIGATNNLYNAIFTNTTPLEELVFAQWEKTFGGSGADSLAAAQQTSDGGYILGGTSDSPISGNRTNSGFGGLDYWIVKVDAAGMGQWQRTFGGTGSDQLTGLQQTSDGGYILCGVSTSGVGGNKTTTNFGGYDFWIIKTDALGVKQWEQSFGGTLNEDVASIQQTTDGGYIVGGRSRSDANGNKTSLSFGSDDFWVIKTDSAGNKQWEKSFGGATGDDLYAIRQTSDGGYVFGGPSSSSIGGSKAVTNYGANDWWVIKTDGDGNELWQRGFGTDSGDTLYAIEATSDSGCVLAGAVGQGAFGNRTAPEFGNYDSWLIKLDAAGNAQWQQSFGGTDRDEAYALSQVADGGYLIGGLSASGANGNKTSPAFGGTDGWVVRTDWTGQKKWDLALGGNGSDQIVSSAKTSDGGYILAGTSDSPASGNKTATNFGSNDFWVVKLLSREAPVGMPAVLVNGQYSPSNSFSIPATNTIQVTLQTTFPNGLLFYTLDGSEPDLGSTEYAGPFTNTGSATIRAIAYTEDYSDAQANDPVTISVVPLYILAAVSQGGGSISNVSSSPYLSNSLASVSAIASNGWTFLNWTGDASGTNNPLSLTMDRAKSIGAAFGTQIITNVPGGGGFILLQPTNGPYAFGSMVRLSAVPNAGKYFNRWAGAANGYSNSPLNFVVTNTTPTTTALFSTLNGNNRSLTVLINGDGTVTKNPQLAFYGNNSSVTLTATPGSNSVFMGWSGDTNGTQNPLAVVMDTNKTIYATFASAALSNSPPTVSLSSPADGAVFTNLVPITLSATANDTDGSIVRVEFYDGSTLLSAPTNAPYNYAWSNATVGAHVLSAQAIDNQGAHGTSAPVSITLQTALPLVSLLSPTNGNVFITPASILVSAVASDADNSIARVELYSQAATNNSQPFLLSSITNPPYNFTWSGMATGGYSLTTRAVDSYGPIVTSTPVVITVTPPPTTNPPLFVFSQTNFSVNESNGSVAVTVLNNGDLAGSVSYQTADGTAHGGSGGFSGDYTTVSGNTTLGGHQATNITIQILDNYLNRADIQFEVQLRFPSEGAALGNPSTATVTIHENDTGDVTNRLLAVVFPTGQPPVNGRLAVTVGPPEAGGQWRFPWELAWRNSGQTASNLVQGNYEIEFRNLPGWLAVPPRVSSIQVTSGGIATITTNVYYPTSLPDGTNSVAGSLTVNLGATPPSGAGWRFIGDTTPFLPSGYTTNLLAGTYLIEFAGPFSGRSTPPKGLAQVFAGQPTVVSVSYPLSASAPSGVALPAQVAPANVTDYADWPFGFNGQLQTDVGYGSGVAVRQNVVLTAAHMVFNDQTLSFVSQAYWSFQQETGVFQPEPLLARGWVMRSGYSAQRTNDLQIGGYSPDQSSPQSRELDVAALYFLSPAARTGYGGYLGSDAVPNPWLTGSNLKMLVGYPVDGSPFGDASIVPGKMYSTPQLPQSSTFTLVSNHVYTAGWLLSYPGNSGGPLYVQFTNNYYYPAAVYLGTLYSGGSYQSVVRAIDSDVVNLIGLAASQGDTGTNFTGGGVITFLTPNSGSGDKGYLQVTLEPAEARAANAGCKLSTDSGYMTAHTNLFPPQIPGTNTLQFRQIPGWDEPPTTNVTLVPGQITRLVATYVAIKLSGARLADNGTIVIVLEGATNSVYSIVASTNLAAPLTNWAEVLRITNTTGRTGFTITNPPSAATQRYYRARRL